MPCLNIPKYSVLFLLSRHYYLSSNAFCSLALFLVLLSVAMPMLLLASRDWISSLLARLDFCQISFEMLCSSSTARFQVPHRRESFRARASASCATAPMKWLLPRPDYSHWEAFEGDRWILGFPLIYTPLTSLSFILLLFAPEACSSPASHKYTTAFQLSTILSITPLSPLSILCRFRDFSRVISHAPSAWCHVIPQDTFPLKLPQKAVSQ